MEWISIILVPVIIGGFGLVLNALIKYVKHPIGILVLSIGIRAMSERFPVDGGNGSEKKIQLMNWARKLLGKWFDDEDLSIMIDGLVNKLRDARKLLGNEAGSSMAQEKPLAGPENMI